MRLRWGVGRERKQWWRAVQGGPVPGAAVSGRCASGLWRPAELPCDLGQVTYPL